MIQIEAEKCNSCGLCVKVCHEYCLSLEEGALMIDNTVCSTCAQCVAVCPQQAITWDHHPPERFDPRVYPAPEQVRELFMQRRTTRDYSGKPVDRSLLEEITGYAAYAPTHNFNFRTVVLDEDHLIGMIDTLIYESCLRIYRWFYWPRVIRSLIRQFTPSREFEFLKARPKLEHAIQRKSGFRSKPAAVILILGDKRVPLSLESAQYALYNIDLYGQSKGLACRNLVGNQRVLNRSRTFRNAIGMDRHERIFGTITVGHPAVKFRNKVTGKQLPLQWNGA